jgi:hypothetical protein
MRRGGREAMPLKKQTGEPWLASPVCSHRHPVSGMTWSKSSTSLCFKFGARVQSGPFSRFWECRVQDILSATNRAHQNAFGISDKSGCYRAHRVDGA